MHDLAIEIWKLAKDQERRDTIKQQNGYGYSIVVSSVFDGDNEEQQAFTEFLISSPSPSQEDPDHSRKNKHARSAIVAENTDEDRIVFDVRPCEYDLVRAASKILLKSYLLRHSKPLQGRPEPWTLIKLININVYNLSGDHLYSRCIRTNNSLSRENVVYEQAEFSYVADEFYGVFAMCIRSCVHHSTL